MQVQRRRKPVSFSIVSEIRDIMVKIFDLLLVSSDPVLFGSEHERLAVILISKAFLETFRVKTKRASTCCYFRLPQSLRNLPITHRNVRFEGLGQIPLYWENALADLESVHFHRCAISAQDIPILLKATPGIKSVKLSQCSLQLTDWGSHENLMNGVRVSKQSTRCISYIFQMILPFRGIPQVTIEYCAVAWQAAPLDSKYCQISWALPERTEDNQSAFELSLDSAENLGILLHWLAYFSRTQGSGAVRPWEKFKLVYSHLTTRDILEHHELDSVPIYIHPAYFRDLNVARPTSGKLDKHSVIWKSLQENSSLGSTIVIDRAEDIQGQIFQYYNSATREFLAEASCREITYELNRVMLETYRFQYTMDDNVA